jgi:hypothetical protein
MDVVVALITLSLIYLILLAAGILPWVLLRREKMTTLHRVVTLVTAILPTVPGMVNIFFLALLHWEISNPCAFVTMGLIAGAILASVYFAIAHKGEIAKDIGVGIGIAIIVDWLGEMMLPNTLFPAIFPA